MKKKDLKLEIKSLGDNGTFMGYGSVFGNVDAYGDIVERGAFTESIKDKRPAMLWQHDSRQPVGVWESLSEDDYGLRMEGRLLVGKVERATEAWELIKAGAVSGLSIGYVPTDFSFEKRGGEEVCVLKKIDLWEVSLVTFPANERAQVQDIKELKSFREIEDYLRDAGFSRGAAKALLSRTKDCQRDADTQHGALEGAKSAAQRTLALIKAGY